MLCQLGQLVLVVFCMQAVRRVLEDRYLNFLSDPGTDVVIGIVTSSSPSHPGLTRLVHSHWSNSYITALSLVESFPSDAGASNLMLARLYQIDQHQDKHDKAGDNKEDQTEL